MKILKHLNIVKLLEVINIEETLFIVMEYLSGGNLFTYLEAKNGLKEGRPEAHSTSWSWLCSTATSRAWCTGT